MPIFKCPKCGREGYMPMAFCDEVLHKLPPAPDCEDFSVFIVTCNDCEADSQALNEPVKWDAPNCRFADD
jgi:hypothetical protein